MKTVEPDDFGKKLVVNIVGGASALFRIVATYCPRLDDGSATFLRFGRLVRLLMDQ